MNRKQRLEKYLRYWQNYLLLPEWKITIEEKEFNREDYHQTGDVEVDIKNKRGVVYITPEETGHDARIILHELLHLIMWDYDTFAEKNLKEEANDEYFRKLEDYVHKMTRIILDSNQDRLMEIEKIKPGNK